MKFVSSFFTVFVLSLMLIGCGDTEELSAAEQEDKEIERELEELERRVKK